jgi:hypothetical protein
MKKTLPILLSLFPLVVTAADKHVHGEADLFLAIEGQKILIEWESPAANILGFEHHPNTSEQETILANAIEKLQNYQTLINFTKADCQQVDMTIKAPFSVEHASDKHDEHKHEHHSEHKDEHKGHDNHKDEHKGHDSAHKERHEGEEHSEFHVSYTLQCTNINPIKRATIDAFKAFSGVDKVTVNWLTADKQGSVIKTANDTELHL